MPDARLGQAIHLVVRAAPGRAADDAREALPKALAAALPNFMVPQAFHWREAMPVSANGKLDRAALMQELAA